MKWNIFGNKLSKDLHQYSSEVDPLEIWANIEPQVDALNESKKKDRKPIFWIFFFGLSSILGILLFTQIFNVDSDQLNPTFNQEKRNTQNNVLQEEAESIHDLKNFAKTSKTQQSNPKKEVSESTPAIQNTESKNQSLPLNLRVEKQETELQNEKTQQATLPDKPLKKEQNSKTSTTNESRRPVSTSKVKQSQASEISKRFNKIKRDTPTEKPIMNNEIDINKKQVSSNKVTSIEENQDEIFLTRENKREQWSLNLIPIRSIANPFSSDTYKLTDDDVPLIIYIEDKDLTKPLKQKVKWSLHVFAGAGMINRKMDSKSSEHNNLLILRTNTESVLEAQQFGLLVNIGKDRGFQFTTGLQATYLIEKFEFLDLIRDTVYNPAVEYRYISLRGDTINVNGQIPTFQTFEFNKKIYNSHRLFEIPLLVGYKTHWNNLGITAYTGIFANVNLTSEGEILDIENVFISVRETGSNIYKPKVGLSYHFGFELEKRFTNNLSLQLKPTFQYYLNDFTNASYGLEQRYWIIGGNAGLKYTF